MTDPFSGVSLADLPPATALTAAASTFHRNDRRPNRPERRRAYRYPARAEVAVRAIASDGSPAGDPFRAVATELSRGGMRLLCDRPAETPRLAVRFGLHPTGHVRILDATRARETSGLYEYAGEFASPLHAAPRAQPEAASPRC